MAQNPKKYKRFLFSCNAEDITEYYRNKIRRYQNEENNNIHLRLVIEEENSDPNNSSSDIDSCSLRSYAVDGITFDGEVKL